MSGSVVVQGVLLRVRVTHFRLDRAGREWQTWRWRDRGAFPFLDGGPVAKGGRTVVTLERPTGLVVARGEAVCSARDNFDRRVGRELALERACRAAADALRVPPSFREALRVTEVRGPSEGEPHGGMTVERGEAPPRDSLMLRLIGETDATKFAAAFVAMPNRDAISQGLGSMTAWFAVAIEAGRQAGRI